MFTFTQKKLLKIIIKKITPKPIFVFIIKPTIRFILSRIFNKNGYKINIGNAGEYFMSPDFIFRGWEEFGNRHNKGFSVCIEKCNNKSIFFDVGAHIGLYSLPVSQILKPSGKVIAFEPSNSNYEYLVKHIQYNQFKNIFPHKLIIGNNNIDEVTFYEHSTYSSPLSGIIKRSKNPSDKFFATKKAQISLDYFCEKNKLIPDVIKIDVEGSELNVLQGAKNILTQYKPIIFLSVHPEHLTILGQKTIEINNFLEKYEYKIYYTDESIVNNELKSEEYICISK